MNTDILAAIDDTLEHWRGSDDSARWRPAPLIPRLTPQQAALARRLCHDTGIDGYAAALAVADVGEHGQDSPYWDLVAPAAKAVLNEAAEPFVRWLEVKAEECRQSLLAFGEAMTKALTPAIRQLAADLGPLLRAMEDGGASAGDPELASMHREYARRRKARQRRKREH